MATALYNGAQVFQKLGQNEQALEWHMRALKLRQALFPGNNADVAHSLNDVGLAYDELGRHEEGLEYYQRALRMLEAVH